MVIQIINLTFPEVFKIYREKFNVFRDVYQKGLLGIEIRNISNSLAEAVQKIVLEQNEICYKCFEQDGKTVSVFIPGAVWNFKELSKKILSYGDEDLGYKLINVIKNYEEYELKQYSIAGKVFTFDKTYIMGVLNITPDSFSDGGKYFNSSAAVKHGLDLINDGADIIDVGGESTRPGSESISEKEELSRAIPVIEQLLKEKPQAILSIDTTKSAVAEEALKRGVKIINDISGVTFDPLMISVAKRYDAAVVVMHIKGTPKDMQENPAYHEVVSEIYDFLYEQTELIKKQGVKNIIIDPGIGFGKTAEDNYTILKRLEDFKGLGYPILIGVSKKSFLGKTLNLEVDQRDSASIITEAIAVKMGARIIRTHNVKNGVQVAKLLNLLA